MTKKGNWVIIGRHAVLESLTGGQALDKVMIDRMINLPDIQEACKKSGIPVQKVPRERLDKFGTNHQGVAAFKAMVEFQQLDELVPHLYEQGKTPLLLILDRITDVGNFGAISRSAEVLGADVIIFPSRESAQLNADAVKRSAGALLRVPLCREKDLGAAIRFLQQSGIMVLAADEKGKTSIQSVDFTKPVAIILGSEGEGVAPDLLRKADEIVFIPQAGSMDSLNVSVATGIILYEAQRQRTGSSK
jgi:23S rRNA (guanosine2251-2'-O)-methyltransferase